MLCAVHAAKSVSPEGSAKHQWLHLYKAVSMCFAAGGVMLRFSAGRALPTRPGLTARPCRLNEMRRLLCTVSGYSTNPAQTLAPVLSHCMLYTAVADCTGTYVLMSGSVFRQIIVQTNPWGSLNSLNGMLPLWDSAVCVDSSFGFCG